jgi:hypothetical protein
MVFEASAVEQSLTMMIHSLRLAVCSLCRYSISEQNRSRIHFQPSELDSVVVAQGAAHRRQSLDR